MKMKFIDRFDGKRGKGYEVEIDRIKYLPEFSGLYAVRVVSEWKRPTWIAISWFLKEYAEYGLK